MPDTKASDGSAINPPRPVAGLLPGYVTARRLLSPS